MKSNGLLLPAACAALIAVAPCFAEPTLDRPVEIIVPHGVDGGVRFNPAAAEAAVHSAQVRVEGAPWLRLHFGPAMVLDKGSFVRLTSALDGEMQELDADGIARWGGSSAYFNGDAVLVELVAGPQAGRNRLVIAQVSTEAAGNVAGDPGECGICEADDRLPSSEGWTARLLPAGCTASVWNRDSCMVSAGHCIQEGMTVQFNVPDSAADCTIVHPPVADQFPVVAFDSASGGVGNDWSVLVPGPNAAGELPFERYGQYRPLGGGVVTPAAAIALTGYGVNTFCPWSQTQQTSGGVITEVAPAHLEYDADVRIGNSGTAIMRDGEIVGIVTHCGCPNFGTRVDVAGFARARDELCGAALGFTYPVGVPQAATPGETVVVPVVVSAGGEAPQPGSGTLHRRVNGSPYVAEAMTESASHEYDAVLPAASCADVIDFYVDASTTTGGTMTSPPAAPAVVHSIIAAAGLDPVFADDFQVDRGWTVQDAGLTDGRWERALPVPAETCDRGNPAADADGSGWCFLTDNDAANCNSDVDGGSTTLTSPAMDASGGAGVLSYWRWFSNTGAGQGSNAYQDVMTVEISADDGSSWALLETVGPADDAADGGWIRRSFDVDDVVGPTTQLRVRFIVSDADPPSVVEAGVDGVELATAICGACLWDLDGDDAVGVTELLALLGGWGTAPGGPPDLDGNGAVDVVDLLTLLGAWGACGAL